jgi:signal transduction histidine kinase
MSAQQPADPEHDLQRLRHDLANPLSALLAEVQLLLLDASRLSPDVVTALRGIEAMAVRMRTILRS